MRDLDRLARRALTREHGVLRVGARPAHRLVLRAPGPALAEPPGEPVGRGRGLRLGPDLGQAGSRDPALRLGPGDGRRLGLRRPVSDYQGFETYRAYELVPNRVKLFDERALGAATFVGARVARDGKLTSERTEVYG